MFVPSDPELRLLSFNNLAEGHVLAATRYEHKVPFPIVRGVISNLVTASPEVAAHPLLSDEFLTNGAILFVEGVNKELVNVTNEQLSLDIMKKFVVRVLKDKRGPFKIYPLKKGEPEDNVICITAGVSGSRPIIDGTGIPVEAVWRRIRAGEELGFIADDYDLLPDQVRRVQIYGELRAA